MNEPARKTKQVGPQIVPATLEDLLAIPDEERRHELIEGTIYPTKEATTAEHGAAQWALSVWLGPHGRRPGGRNPGGWWFVTEVEVYFDAQNTFKPDVAGWRRERVPERPSGTPIRIRPDWVCEILSTNRSHDIIRKKRVHHRHEIPHYWIIDPVGRSLEVFRWMPGGYLGVQIGEFKETLRAEPFEAIPLFVGALFGEDEEESQDEGLEEKAEKAD